MPKSRPLSAIRMSGRSPTSQSSTPSATGASPPSDPGPIQSASTSPADAIRPRLAGGPAGTPITAPPSPATKSATAMM